MVVAYLKAWSTNVPQASPFEPRRSVTLSNKQNYTRIRGRIRNRYLRDGNEKPVLVLRRFSIYSVILSVLDPRKCEYLKDYSLDFEHAYMTTYLAS